MEFPAQLRCRINQLLENEDMRVLSRAAARLSERYRSGTDGRRSASGRSDILAYAAVRMPATFAAVSRALELSLECFGGEIGSVLDIGAGTGAGAVAASLLTGCGNIVCIEREPNMAELGRDFFRCMEIPGDWIERDIMDGIPEKADLVICSYCLNELPSEQTEAAVRELAAAARKLLLIVEPGTPGAFAVMREIRRQLADHGMSFAAPCPADCAVECSLPSDDWCHFLARAARSRLHKRLKGVEVPYEDEKFCFLAAAKESALPCAGRILRRPVIETGQVTLKICAAGGVFSEVVAKRSPRFKAARKSGTGDKQP